jgi:hypothetical protein
MIVKIAQILVQILIQQIFKKKIFFRLLIGKLSGQHYVFPNTTSLGSKDIAIASG